MTKNPKTQPDDPEESKRFIEKAREIETDEDPKAFERAIKQILKTSRGRATEKPDRQ